PYACLGLSHVRASVTPVLLGSAEHVTKIADAIVSDLAVLISTSAPEPERLLLGCLDAVALRYSVIPYSGTRHYAVPLGVEEDSRWTT
ncbi:hypothetical protein, partial [Streptomyces violaceusniger]|uniref:hypothetical protein n=1 Tax=Streptomyces violaceusniger TaxID=68280 RepID=UPI0031CEB39B